MAVPILRTESLEDKQMLDKTYKTIRTFTTTPPKAAQVLVLNVLYVLIVLCN